MELRFSMLYPLTSLFMHINILFPQRRKDAEKLTLCVPCDTARDNAFQIYLFGGGEQHHEPFNQ